MLERDRILLPHPPSSDSNGGGSGSSSSSGGGGDSSSSSSGGGGSSSSSSSSSSVGTTTTSTTESSSSSGSASIYSSGAAHITLLALALTAVGTAFYLLLVRRRRRRLQRSPKIDGRQLMPVDTAPSSDSTLTFDNISQQSSYIDIELAPSMNFHPLGGGIYLLNQSREEQEDTSGDSNTWKPDDGINVYLPPKRPTHSEDENADMSSMTDEFNSSTQSEDGAALFDPDSQGNVVPPSTICSICFKEEFGTMKACECGRPICNRQAHLICAQKINPGPSVAHPGTPAPRLPTVLCSGGTLYCTAPAPILPLGLQQQQHQHQQEEEEEEEPSSRSRVSAHTVR